MNNFVEFFSCADRCKNIAYPLFSKVYSLLHSNLVSNFSQGTSADVFMVLFGCFCKETRNLLVQVGVIFFKFTIVIELCRLAVLYVALLPTFNNSSGKSSSRLATKLFYNKLSDLFVVNTADPTMVKKVLDCLQYIQYQRRRKCFRTKQNIDNFYFGETIEETHFSYPFPINLYFISCSACYML